MKPQEVTDQVAEIYTLMCRAALNRDYYGVMLARNQRTNTWFDILIAAGTTGSGLSALTIWEMEFGRIVWGVLSAASALLALSKPIIQLNKKIERLSRLFVGHSDNYVTLLILVSRIRRKQDITDEMSATFEAAEVRFLELSKEDDPTPDKKLLAACQQEVRLRHPPEKAWFPRPLETHENVVQ